MFLITLFRATLVVVLHKPTFKPSPELVPLFFFFLFWGPLCFPTCSIPGFFPRVFSSFDSRNQGTIRYHLKTKHGWDDSASWGLGLGFLRFGFPHFPSKPQGAECPFASPFAEPRKRAGLANSVGGWLLCSLLAWKGSYHRTECDMCFAGGLNWADGGRSVWCPFGSKHVPAL